MMARWVYYWVWVCWVCGISYVGGWGWWLTWGNQKSCLSLSLFSSLSLIIRGLISRGEGVVETIIDRWTRGGHEVRGMPRGKGMQGVERQGRKAGGGKRVGDGRSVQLRVGVTREVCWFHLRVPLGVEASQARGKLLLCRV